MCPSIPLARTTAPPICQTLRRFIAAARRVDMDGAVSRLLIVALYSVFADSTPSPFTAGVALTLSLSLTLTLFHLTCFLPVFSGGFRGRAQPHCTEHPCLSPPPLRPDSLENDAV
ncbi:hypothetical protein V8C26DRAFT_398914 [Trichoderma gracile]